VYWKKRLVQERVALSLVEVARFQPAPIMSPSRPLRLTLGNRCGIEIELTT
jgi:hypothetical protein